MIIRGAIALALTALCTNPLLATDPEIHDSSRVIIGIHGLGPKVDCGNLHIKWSDAIADGIAHHEESRQSIPFRIVHWAEEEVDGENRCPAISDEPTLAQHLEMGVADMSVSLIERIPDAPFDAESLCSSLPRTTAGALDQLRREKYFPWSEVTTYYGASQKAEAWREELRAVLRRNAGRQIMLIAHSMGSLIAYDVLMEEEGPDIDHWVTIGSPLATTTVKKAICEKWSNKLSVPERVKRWTNLASRFDPVAMDGTMRNSFAANQKEVTPRDHFVSAWIRGEEEFQPAKGRKALSQLDIKRYHSICGYLTNSAMAEIVDDFLRSD